MKKVIVIISTLVLILAMGTTGLAATVYPDGGKDTPFSGEKVGGNVEVGVAEINGGNVTEITNTNKTDGYAVDITWGSMKFLYVINKETDVNDYKNAFYTWDPDELCWVLVDEDGNKIVIEDMEGAYDEDGFAEFQGIFTKDMTTSTETTINKDLGINGFAVSNRSSQAVAAAVGYTSLLPIYANANVFEGATTASIAAVAGQIVPGTDSIATVTTYYNSLRTPDNAPNIAGTAGRITITIG